jgi:hypothetical protein
VKHFCKYLESDVSRIRANFSRFGLADSGALYIVRQLQSAIDHFERPVQGRRGDANPLDA